MAKEKKSVAEDALEEMQSPENFDLAKFVTSKVTYPTRNATIFTDGARGQQALDLADEIANLQMAIEGLQEDSGTISGADTEHLDEQVREKTLELEELFAELEKSQLTFVMRGVAPKVWRVIDKSWRNKIPANKDADAQTNRELDITRNEKVNIDIVRNAIVKIVTPEGAFQEGTPSFDAVEALYDNLLESEWAKLKDTAEQLTFANNLFEGASVDADFLPKSSPGEATGDTSDQ